MKRSPGSMSKSTAKEWIFLMNSTVSFDSSSLIHFASTEIEVDIRRRLFARFPYSLIYGIEEQTLIVIAVAHSRRAPRYWVDRL